MAISDMMAGVECLCAPRLTPLVRALCFGLDCSRSSRGPADQRFATGNEGRRLHCNCNVIGEDHEPGARSLATKHECTCFGVRLV